MSHKRLQITFVSSYPPRECGIATFTQDLLLNIIQNDPAIRCSVCAIDPSQESDNYGCLSPLIYSRSKVTQLIKDKDPISFIEAAMKLNASGTDVINIQHEFGLYGGEGGSNIIEFIEAANKPIVTTLHTILPDPPEVIQSMTHRLFTLSDAIVVSANVGVDILTKTYGLTRDKLSVIPHGVPDVPFISTYRPKKKLNLSDRFILATFGLIHPAKGIDYVIGALPQIIADNPRVNILYLVVGDTHPNIVKQSGESYRQNLKALVKELHLEQNVHFVDRYLTNRELILYFLATDICILPYLGRDQISSGVLSQAIGCGKAIVATPFLHAQDVLSDGRGMLVDFQSINDIAEKSSLLIQNEVLRREMETATYMYGRSITWSQVAKKYVKLFDSLTTSQAYSQAAFKLNTSDVDIM